MLNLILYFQSDELTRTRQLKQNFNVSFLTYSLIRMTWDVWVLYKKRIIKKNKKNKINKKWNTKDCDLTHFSILFQSTVCVCVRLACVFEAGLTRVACVFDHLLLVLMGSGQIKVSRCSISRHISTTAPPYVGQHLINIQYISTASVHFYSVNRSTG